MANVVTITIVVTDTGQMLVTAPFEQEVFCLGLLEKAKTVVQDENKKLNNRIVQPTQQDKTFLQKLHLKN
jgi:hypothetical protein